MVSMNNSTKMSDSSTEQTAKPNNSETKLSTSNISKCFIPRVSRLDYLYEMFERRITVSFSLLSFFFKNRRNQFQKVHQKTRHQN